MKRLSKFLIVLFMQLKIVGSFLFYIHKISNNIHYFLKKNKTFLMKVKTLKKKTLH